MEPERTFKPCEGERPLLTFTSAWSYTRRIAQQFIECVFDVKKKGFKKAKGEPAYWDEVKRSLNLTLTPTAIDGLQALANEKELSRSELVERIGRGIIEITSPPERDN